MVEFGMRSLDPGNRWHGFAWYRTASGSDRMLELNSVLKVRF